jgi:hypothetical protein
VEFAEDALGAVVLLGFRDGEAGVLVVKYNHVPVALAENTVDFMHHTWEEDAATSEDPTVFGGCHLGDVNHVLVNPQVAAVGFVEK